MPPHRLWASVVLAGISLAGCYRAHRRTPDADAGRPHDAGTDAGRDGGSDAGCAALSCEICDPRPECMTWPCEPVCIF